jgi:homogentisate 1,2-dioxygenase
VAVEHSLEKANISQQAARLTEPFTMIDLAQVDDLVISVFLCQGTLPFHRHLDQDELFLVHSGTISLESDWGTVILRPGELAVVPKGLSHRSSSLPNSLVLLLQARLAVNRRNGDRRLFALKGARRLEKANLSSVGRQIIVPFRAVPVAQVDTFTLQLTSCRGTSPWQQMTNQASLVLCYKGTLLLESEIGQLTLREGDLSVVPTGITHRVSSSEGALVVGLQRHQQPGLAARDASPGDSVS